MQKLGHQGREGTCSLFAQTAVKLADCARSRPRPPVANTGILRMLDGPFTP